jgi:hypothetical protein
MQCSTLQVSAIRGENVSGAPGGFSGVGPMKGLQIYEGDSLTIGHWPLSSSLSVASSLGVSLFPLCPSLPLSRQQCAPDETLPRRRCLRGLGRKMSPTLMCNLAKRRVWYFNAQDTASRTFRHQPPVSSVARAQHLAVRTSPDTKSAGAQIAICARSAGRS